MTRLDGLHYKQFFFYVVDLQAQIHWVGEKTPGALEPVIPDARCILLSLSFLFRFFSPLINLDIYIIRDGRDALVSLFFHVANVGGFEGFCPLGSLIPRDYIDVSFV